LSGIHPFVDIFASDISEFKKELLSTRKPKTKTQTQTKTQEQLCLLYGFVQSWLWYQYQYQYHSLCHSLCQEQDWCRLCHHIKIRAVYNNLKSIVKESEVNDYHSLDEDFSDALKKYIFSTIMRKRF
jgi:hypothetical protein